MRSPIQELLPREREPFHFTGLVRQCSLCRRTQPLDQFVNDTTKPHGHDQECRICNQERDHQPVVPAPAGRGLALVPGPRGAW